MANVMACSLAAFYRAQPLDLVFVVQDAGLESPGQRASPHAVVPGDHRDRGRGDGLLQVAGARDDLVVVVR
jgi:hypothetical protein